VNAHRALLLVSLAQVAMPGAAASAERTPPGRTLTVGDAAIYYEVHGSGPSVVLLHGGLFGSIEEFSRLIPELARTRQVIAIEARGHGRSELGSARLSYSRHAEDVAAIIRATGGGQADVVGFSDGAITGYHLAAGWPSLVRRLVAVGGPLGLYGYSAAGRSELAAYDSASDLEARAPAFVAARRRVMPDPAVWPRFVEELAAMWHENDYIRQAAVRSISCPVLLLAGDRDEYLRAEHLLEIHRLLPQSELAVVPGTGHLVLASRPALAHALITHFLDQP
jgi:pimeloyl-ACP methyl ester carboxylesterase